MFYRYNKKYSPTTGGPCWPQLPKYHPPPRRDSRLGHDASKRAVIHRLIDYWIRRCHASNKMTLKVDEHETPESAWSNVLPLSYSAWMTNAGATSPEFGQHRHMTRILNHGPIDDTPDPRCPPAGMAEKEKGSLNIKRWGTQPQARESCVIFIQ
ncbi:hypothetical protein BDV40DRAFT_265962 [Aspergillus tamarii]|uniref:Uncharacterized protein n=1 Tax=Aspergillus tamarii TaxID=41984 RepID=A0A5N6UTX5_ASPTM|nr:hypothetical protein BDV40DRAFT_265962 [Aspergillus tamarii]